LDISYLWRRDAAITKRGLISGAIQALRGALHDAPRWTARAARLRIVLSAGASSFLKEDVRLDARG